MVYLAEDLNLNRKVAIKLLNEIPDEPATAVSGLYPTPQKAVRQRFQEEAQTLVQLEFEGIVRIYDFGEFEGQLYLVMQYMPGDTLADKLRSHPLPLPETAGILNRLCATLDKVHQHGYVHRDLKPLNILFDAEGQANLSDFGIARLAEKTNPTAEIGTPRYMAPEQFQGEKLGAYTDIYQMGVVLFEMLTGTPPFNASTGAAVMKKVLGDPPPSITELNPDLPPELDDVLHIAMAKEPAARYVMATDLARHFEALVYRKQTPVGLPPVPPGSIAKETVSPTKKRSKLAWLITAGLLIPLLLIGYSLLRPSSLAPITPSPTGPGITPAGLSIVLVTATDDPDRQPQPELLSGSVEPTIDQTAALAAETVSAEAHSVRATQTSLAEMIEATNTPAPTTNPTPTAVVAITSADLLAPQTNRSLLVDGDLTDWPPLVPVLSAYRVFEDDSWDGSEDMTVTWQLAWDDLHLYIGVNVVDDIHVQTESGNQIFKGDSVSLQIDTDLAADLSAEVSPDDFQIDLSPGDFATLPPSAFRFQGNNEDWMVNAPGHTILVQAQKTADGYILEAAIPWADLNMVPTDGQILGLALNATDNDTSGTAVQELFLSNVPDRQFNTPNSWGTLTLQGNSILSRTIVSTSTPLPPASLMMDDFEYRSINTLNEIYWINSPGNEVELQLVRLPHGASDEQALAVHYRFRRDDTDSLGIERNLDTPVDWNGYSTVCFWSNNEQFEGFIIFQFREYGSETWKYQTALSPGYDGEFCIPINRDSFTVASEKLNDLLDLTAVDNYAIYLSDGGASEGTVYIDAIQLKP